MNYDNRAELVKAMERIARCVNDEEIFEGWLISGIADGDVEADTPEEELDWYCEDKTFADLMDTFLWLMSKARKSGGLYCDGVVSEAED